MHAKQLAILSITLLLSGCVGQNPNPYQLLQPELAQTTPVVPKYEPLSPYGNPAYYNVAGERYRVLRTARGYRQRGIASWYGPKFNGQLTSTRERFDMYKISAASPVLPIPCYVRVTNLQNGKQIVVRVNDRGPFAKNRILDLSYAAAKKLGYVQRGTALVEVATINVRHPDALAPTILPQHPHLYLQLGAFSHYQNATRFQHYLQHYTSRHTRIQPTTVNSLPIYRVQIGPLRDVEESDRLQNQLARAGLGHAITKIY